jgi:Ras-related protein Rab-24
MFSLFPQKECKIYLVGTKLDILLDNSKQRAVDLDVVARYSNGIQAQSIETSSKTGANVGKCWRPVDSGLFNDFVLT